MPELPEVETIRRGLEKRTLGLKIKEVEVNASKVVKEPAVASFKKSLVNQKFTHAIRRGKCLILKLSSGKSLVIHLRLTGFLTHGKKDEKARVNFLFANAKYLNYLDQRLLGELRLVNDYQKVPFIAELGIEPLEKDFTAKKFAKILKGKKTKIKPLLMNQKLIAGIGNIYASESLFRVKINPARVANSLKPHEIKSLHKTIRDILQEAIKYRGTSADTYRDIDGREGNFLPRLQVYGRERKPCFRCKTPIKKITIDGRGTYFCPKCQK